MEMTTENMTKLGIALAAVFVVWKFVPSQAAKCAALGVGGVIVAKQLPYVSDVL